ncbi:uncharacterized protein B0H18DRAFT_601025 [Fomitopsis serialis]|uniref:uncharacterized protein n=1 Tax=Fomitopsis serialis TaxID=139415 RepID=UPI00200720FA|nr:uncharacterized protein B0H18DRAFT_601025 [Neoantrodia serialis]KAH9933772.1 hypothetical protein B0H18DRAFT_601025 [Neoantrodia serialis]
MSFVPRYGARLIGPNGAYDDYGFEEHDNVLSCYVEFAGSTFPYRCAFQNATGHDVRVFLSAAGNSLCNSCHFGPMEAGFVGQCPDPEEVDLRINARGARPKEEQRLKPITIPHSNPYFAANRDIIELRVFNVGPLTRAANATLADGRLSAPASLTKQGSADWMATPRYGRTRTLCSGSWLRTEATCCTTRPRGRLQRPWRVLGR